MPPLPVMERALRSAAGPRGVKRGEQGSGGVGGVAGASRFVFPPLCLACGMRLARCASSARRAGRRRSERTEPLLLSGGEPPEGVRPHPLRKGAYEWSGTLGLILHRFARGFRLWRRGWRVSPARSRPTRVSGGRSSRRSRSRDHAPRRGGSTSRSSSPRARSASDRARALRRPPNRSPFADEAESRREAEKPRSSLARDPGRFGGNASS
jgi:hypothetical protein